MECCWKRDMQRWLNSSLFPMSCCHIQTCHLLSCLSFAVKSGISFRSSFSCQSFTLTGTTCSNFFQWHSQLATFQLVLKFTYLPQSGVFISSSFSCQAFMLTGSHLFHWQAEQSVCSYLSPPLLQPFLLLLVFLCRCRSFPPLIGNLGQPWSRISAKFCIQPVYTTASACIHRHTVGTRASAAYNFRSRCQHSCSYPCTVSAHTPTVLPGYLL